MEHTIYTCRIEIGVVLRDSTLFMKGTKNCSSWKNCSWDYPKKCWLNRDLLKIWKNVDLPEQFQSASIIDIEKGVYYNMIKLMWWKVEVAIQTSDFCRNLCIIVSFTLCTDSWKNYDFNLSITWRFLWCAYIWRCNINEQISTWDL